ncbi:extracellular solute-binding protein [Paenibacillus abyssi]|nr:extracellular solute-binding protein [Paenibacillus abyssi]
MKWLPCMLAGLLMMMLLSGCSGFLTGSANPAGGQGHAVNDNVTLSIFANLHTAQIPKDTIELLLEEKTGVKLDIQWIPNDSYDEKVNASIATGTLPQAMYLKNAASLPAYKDKIRSGMFWEIGPYLHEFPSLSGLKPEVMNNISVDGKLYGLYQERALSRQGLIYRKDWADKLSLSAPETLDELYEMLKAFTENDPDGNGIRDTIGLADRSDLIYGAFKTVSSYFGTPNGWGFMDGALLPEFMFPEYIHTMAFFRRLHEEGLINRNFPVTGKADQQDLLINGKAGMYIGAMGDIISLEAKLKTNNPTASLDVHNRVHGPKGYGVWAAQGYGTVVLFPKSAVRTEEELKKVLSFFDQLMSPEVANLIYWGVEGKHYEIENGMAIPSGDQKLTDRDVKPYQALLIGGPSTIGGMLQPKFSLPAKEKAEKLTLDNESMLINDPAAPLDSATFNERGVRLYERIMDATYLFMLGMIDEDGFQAEVDRWLQEGGQQIIDEYNVSYNKGIAG